VGSDGTGFLVPGLDLMWLGGSIARSNIERHNQERCARVSLGLLANVIIPEHARYLYQVLGTTWKTGHMATR
jgi:hypothetical protein